MKQQECLPEAVLVAEAECAGRRRHRQRAADALGISIHSYLQVLFAQAATGSDAWPQYRDVISAVEAERDRYRLNRTARSGERGGTRA